MHVLASYSSELDLVCGFWQVQLIEDDMAKASFQLCSLGFFECNRMPVVLLELCSKVDRAAIKEFQFCQCQFEVAFCSYIHYCKV